MVIAAMVAAAVLLPTAFLLAAYCRPFMKHYSLPAEAPAEPVWYSPEVFEGEDPPEEAVREGIQIRLKDRDIVLFRIREQWETGCPEGESDPGAMDAGSSD